MLILYDRFTKHHNLLNFTQSDLTVSLLLKYLKEIFIVLSIMCQNKMSLHFQDFTHIYNIFHLYL